jgi:TPR repeat protein
MQQTSMTKIAAVVALAFVLGGGPAFAKRLSHRTSAFAKDDYVVTTKLMPRAERGDANAQAQLGFMYEHGRGVAQDYVTAVYWYTAAAAQGHPSGQYLLGLMYDKGHGVARSATLAYMWLNLAAAHAPPRAQAYYSRIRDAIAAKLSPAQVAAAQWQAATVLPGL